MPALKGPIQIDSYLFMPNVVLKNQVVVGSVNAGREDFAGATRDLGAFEKRWPEALPTLICGRYPMGDVETLVKGWDGIKKLLAIAGTKVDRAESSAGGRR